MSGSEWVIVIVAAINTIGAIWLGYLRYKAMRNWEAKSGDLNGNHASKPPGPPPSMLP